MRTCFLALLVAALFSACSQAPAPKLPLPITVNKMTGAELKKLYAECTKYGLVSDPRVIYSVEDCAHLQALINAASWTNTYTPHPVGQPMLH